MNALKVIIYAKTHIWMYVAGVSSLPQILAEQLTLSQPGGADYSLLTTNGTPLFSDLPTALCRYSFNCG